MIPDDKLLKIANKLFEKRFEKPMYPYQRQMFLTRNTNRIVNKSRQMGISEEFA